MSEFITLLFEQAGEYKSGNKRPITLLNVTYEIYTKAL